MNDNHKSDLDEVGQNQDKLQNWHKVLESLTRLWSSERREVGRYTLEEAAFAIVNSVVKPNDPNAVVIHHESGWPLLWRMIQAARFGQLTIFSREGLKAVPDNAPIMEWFSRETYWKDLNAWLEENEPNVTFRFPPPSKVGQSSEPCSNVTAPAEKPSSEVTDANSERAIADRDKDEWKVVARKLAQEIGEKKWRLGMREVTARNVAASVETQLSSIGERQYWGKRGPRSASSIRNEALVGWKFTPPK